MATVAPLDRLTGTLDALPFTIDTVGDRVAWTAIALDHMDGWGALDSWDYGTLDALSLEVKVAEGVATIAATAASDSVRLKPVSASVSVSASSSSDITRIRPMVASVEAISTATSAFLRVRPFEALVNAVGTATLDGTRIRTVECSASISASATSNSNFLTFASGAASIAVTSASVANGIFSGASGGQVSVTPAVTMTILGEEWTVITPTTPSWGVAPVGAPSIWSTPTAGATGNWLGL